MSESKREKREQRVKKIISLFESLGDQNRRPVKPDSIVTDDPSWNQTEESYQLEQKRWLEEVKKKKKKKR